MKLIIIPFCILLMGMGDPMFLPTPKQPGMIPELQSTTSNLNQIHRTPAEKKTIQEQQEEKPEERYPQQQLMDPQPKSEEKIK